LIARWIEQHRRGDLDAKFGPESFRAHLIASSDGAADPPAAFAIENSVSHHRALPVKGALLVSGLGGVTSPVKAD
jgi:hypothetical protein